MVLGDAVSKLETFVWILNHISKSRTWSQFSLKTSYLVNYQSQHDLSSGGVSSDLLKFEIRPSSLLNFGTANYCCNFGSFVNKSDYIVKTC